MSDSKDSLFIMLVELYKRVVGNEIEIPAYSKETRTNLIADLTDEYKFELIINRKGHRNKNIFSLVFLSSKYRDNKLMRLDFTGQSHRGIETPHVHIFDSKHDFGKNAGQLKDIVGIEVKDYNKALEWFLEENHVNMHETIITKNLV